MEEDELRNKSDDDGGTTGPASGDPSKPSQATRLVQIVEGAGVVLFHDDRGDSWVRIPVKEHRENWPCRSKAFKAWLSHLFWRYEGKAPNSDAKNAAVSVLEAQARFDGPEVCLFNRVAGADGIYWYDLGDKSWRAVRITARGWEVVPDPPTLFRRFAHQRPQVPPTQGGDLERFVELINLKHARQRLLLKVYLVTCFVPDIPHPVPVLYGPQGAAKTTLLRMLRRLVDPSLMETLTLPNDTTELVQQLSHHWLAYYDNLSTLPDWLSDALCRAVTGEGLSKRELYTDDDDIIYNFRRCVGLNGINIAAAKPDLLDRALLFGLDEIPKRGRKAEKALWKEFERLRPSLVGAALDAFSIAIRTLPDIRLAELPRMADFTLWGCAVAAALGSSRDEFLAALDDNFADRNEEIIASSPVATVTTYFMEGRSSWEGTASLLLGELEPVAAKCGVSTKSRLWPKGANALSRRINEVAANLAASGIACFQSRSGSTRRISLERTQASNTAPDEISSPISSPEKPAESQANDDADKGDDISGHLEDPGGITEPEAPPTQRVAGNIVTGVTTVIPSERRLFPCDGIGDDIPARPRRRRSARNARPVEADTDGEVAL